MQKFPWRPLLKHVSKDFSVSFSAMPVDRNTEWHTRPGNVRKWRCHQCKGKSADQQTGPEGSWNYTGVNQTLIQTLTLLYGTWMASLVQQTPLTSKLQKACRISKWSLKNRKSYFVFNKVQKYTNCSEPPNHCHGNPRYPSSRSSWWNWDSLANRQLLTLVEFSRWQARRSQL